jgi:hypothetical protein
MRRLAIRIDFVDEGSPCSKESPTSWVLLATYSADERRRQK